MQIISIKLGMLETFKELHKLYFSILMYSSVIWFSELDQLTGIAALLRFPMPELEDESDDGSDLEND